MFLIVAIVLFLILPAEWDVIALASFLVLGTLEIWFWWHRVRRLPVTAGAATMIGQRATVVRPCRPVGEVKLDGELWRARCDAGADTDDVVTVVGRRRLELLVEPDPGGHA